VGGVETAAGVGTVAGVVAALARATEAGRPDLDDSRENISPRYSGAFS